MQRVSDAGIRTRQGAKRWDGSQEASVIKKTKGQCFLELLRNLFGCLVCREFAETLIHSDLCRLLCCVEAMVLFLLVRTNTVAGCRSSGLTCVNMCQHRSTWVNWIQRMHKLSAQESW